MLCCRRNRAAVYAAISLCLVIAAPGCRQQDEIRSYRVIKESIVEAKGQKKLASKDRMLVAMFPRGDDAWFFKLAGATDRVANHAADFRTFVQSVRFEDNGAGNPVWSRPETWRERLGGDTMRFATLDIPGDLDDLELTVVRLPVKQTDPQQYLLENVNRWRGQMQLPPVDKDGLTKAIEALTIADQNAVLVDLIGNKQSASPMQAPFMGRGMAGVEQPARGTPQTGHDSSVLDCEPPSAWKPARLGMMDSALYRVTDGERKIDIAVRSAGGNLLDNINRWRGQIQLDSINAKQLAESLTPITVDGHQGNYIELGGNGSGTDKAILGVVVKTGDTTWFFKLRGDAELAQRERDNFRDFAKSVRFK
ncbi:MAG: hypothetical protein WBF93_04910 [Pirellulales bacterium]|nr:hypothetical protein [Pirellulales bacterium]